MRAESGRGDGRSAGEGHTDQACEETSSGGIDLLREPTHIVSITHEIRVAHVGVAGLSPNDPGRNAD